MTNYGIKIDLLKLQGACVANIKGKTTTKRCVVIPIDDSNLFLGEKGCYLDITAFEIKEPKYQETHCLKQSLSKELFDSMSDEQRKAIPIIGGLKPIEPRQPAQMEVKNEFDMSSMDEDNDVPF